MKLDVKTPSGETPADLALRSLKTGSPWDIDMDCAMDCFEILRAGRPRKRPEDVNPQPPGKP
jgi:hypothetical protein